MPIFNYEAKTLTGESISGSQEARDEKELAKRLLQKNYILISAESEGEKKEKEIRKFRLPIKRGVSLVERMLFTRHLSVMVGAGFPFERSLFVLANQTKNERFKKILFEIRDDLQKGKSFSSALKKHPKVFSELYSAMVKVGEETGNLKEVLEILAGQMEKDHELLSQVKGAMMYPAVILVIMILIGFLLMIFIMPKFSQMFKELNVELPITTQILVKLGDFMALYWYAVPTAFFILFFLIKAWKKTKTGKRLLDWLSLNSPLVGSLNIKINTARTSRILNSLLTSGVPIVRSLEILSHTLPNSYYKDAMGVAIEDVKKGKTLHESLAPFVKIYTFLLINMIEVGEATGKLGEIVGNLAEFYEREVDNTTKNLSSIIEPILMVIIGGAVGFFALSIFQPIYSMMGAL